MLTQVVLNSTVPRTLNIEAVDPDDLIVVKSISGLTPADVSLFTGEYARNGGYYQGRRVNKRNPVFTLKLNANYKDDIEVSDIREMLYDIFLEPTDGFDGLQVILKDDRKPDRYFVGYTETMDPDLFEQTTNAQISMLCVDPMLYSVTPVVQVEPAGYTNRVIAYDGSAKTGLELTVKVKSITSKISIDIRGQLLVLDDALADNPWALNDEIYICTVEGQHRVYNVTQDKEIMAALTSTSSWLKLRKGNNTMKAYGAVEGDGAAAVIRYAFRSEWWGV